MTSALRKYLRVLPEGVELAQYTMPFLLATYCIKTLATHALNPFELKMKFNMAMVIREYKIFNMISQTTRLNRAITDSYSIITRRRKQMRNVIIAKHFFLFLIKNTFLPTDRFRIKDYLLSFPPFSPSSLPSFSHPSLRFLPSSSSLFLYLSELENTLRINKRQTRFTLTRLVTGRV